MLIKTADPIKSSEITPKSVYLNRRHLMAGGVAALGMGLSGMASAAKLDFVTSPFSTDEEVTPKEAATTYNNFYEFGTSKDDPARRAGNFTTTPWSVKIDGMVDRPADYALEDLVSPHQLEERIYRRRDAGATWFPPALGMALCGGSEAR